MPRAAALVPVLGCVLLGGCAAPTRPPAVNLEPRPVAAQAPAIRETLAEFGNRYLDTKAIDPRAMLVAGVEELGRNVPGMVVDRQGDELLLGIGESRARLSTVGIADLDGLASRLDAGVAWAQGAGPGRSPSELSAAALRGAVRRVDRWGTVLTGEDREGLEGRFKGSMSGIGCRIGRRDDGLAVIEVYPGTPAAEAGLRDGDRLAEVDGVDVRAHAVDEVVARLRGPAGTAVRVTVERGAGERETLEMLRRQIVTPTVASRMLAPDVGYLRVSHIAQNSGATAARMIGGIREAPELRALVLDLRGNTGGSIVAAGQIADQFVESGVLIETVGAHGKPVAGLRPRVAATASTADRKPAAPLVILVDNRTGSSAELLAAALARHDRALLVGERTFGKGVVQKTIPVGAQRELLLKVTVARSLAAGAEIPVDGLLPDIRLDPTVPATGWRCATAAWDTPGAIAAVGVPAGAENDAALTAAMHIVRRYPATSRQELRRALFADLCRGAVPETGSVLPGRGARSPTSPPEGISINQGLA